MNNLAQELRYAARQLRRNPGFTATVLVTLALTIGASRAIFSLVNALMLRSLPYPQPKGPGTVVQPPERTRNSKEPTANSGANWATACRRSIRHRRCGRNDARMTYLPTNRCALHGSIPGSWA